MSDIIEAALQSIYDNGLEWHDCPDEWYREMLAAVTPLIEAAALKEAAMVAHNHGRYSQAYLDGDLPDDVVIHNHACWAIRDKIRALKAQP